MLNLFEEFKLRRKARLRVRILLSRALVLGWVFRLTLTVVERVEDYRWSDEELQQLSELYFIREFTIRSYVKSYYCYLQIL